MTTEIDGRVDLTDRRPYGKAWKSMDDQVEKTNWLYVSLSQMWRAAGSPEGKEPDRWVKAEGVPVLEHVVRSGGMGWYVFGEDGHNFKPKGARVGKGDIMAQYKAARGTGAGMGYAEYLDGSAPK